MKEVRHLLDSDYESMTVPELKQEAKRLGYKGVTKLRNTGYCYIFLLTRSQLPKRGTIDSLKLKHNTKPNKKRPDACINFWNKLSRPLMTIPRLFISRST